MNEPKAIDLPATTDRNGHVIEVGCTVKSYDDPRAPASYIEEDRIEGVVEGCVEFPDCPRYKIRVTRVVKRGFDCSVRDEYLYPPVNGIQRTFGGRTDGVVVLDAPQPATADEALTAAYKALQVVASDPKNRVALDPKALEQVNRALALVESYQDDHDAHMDELEVRMGGCREWDNAQVGGVA